MRLIYLTFWKKKLEKSSINAVSNEHQFFLVTAPPKIKEIFLGRNIF